MTEGTPFQRLAASLPQASNVWFKTIARLTRKFVRHTRDDELASAVDDLINTMVQPRDPSQPPSLANRSIARGLALIGASGTGKSASLRRLFEKHPSFRGYLNVKSESMLLWLSAPKPCTVKALGIAILAASGYELDRDTSAHRMFALIPKRLNAMGKVVICIEEFQHVAKDTSSKDQQEVSDALKHLMEVERFTVIISGIDRLRRFIALDEQLDRRLTKVFFEPVGPDGQPEIEDIITAYAEEVGLVVVPDLLKEIVPRLVHAANYAFGTCIEYAILAIAYRKQLGGDNVLNLEDFAAIYGRKSGKPASQNPFIADRWHEIVCRTTDDDAAEAPPPPTTRRKKRD